MINQLINLIFYYFNLLKDTIFTSPQTPEQEYYTPYDKGIKNKEWNVFGVDTSFGTFKSYNSEDSRKPYFDQKMGKILNRDKIPNAFDRGENQGLKEMELISSIEGMTDEVSEDRMEEMFQNYQTHMKDLYNQDIKPSKIPDPRNPRNPKKIQEIKVGEVDPRVA